MTNIIYEQISFGSILNILSLTTIVFCEGFSQDIGELNLLNYLMKNANLKYVRPASNEEVPVTVTIGITLSQLVMLDAKNQILTTSMWIRQVWNNPFLAWNESLFGGTKTININPDKIWLPDITLYNNAEGDNNFGGSMDKLSTRVILSHTGKCTWLSPAMVLSKCNINIQYFPFDTQTCDLKFGSWTYDGSRLDLQTEGPNADLSKYTDNAEWKLINVTAQRNVVKYICCEELYPDITFTITIRRRSLFYLINLIIPLVMISGLACMTFMVPFESGERVSLSITVLLSMTVFMLLVQDMIPPTSDNVPLVAKFYTAAMIEMGIGVVIACYNLHLYFIDPQFYKMPKWMKTIVLGFLSRLVGVRTTEEPLEEENPSAIPSQVRKDRNTGLRDGGNYDLQSISTLDYLEKVMDYETNEMDYSVEEHNYQWEYENDHQQDGDIAYQKSTKRPVLRRQASIDSIKPKPVYYDNNNVCSNRFENREVSHPLLTRTATGVTDEELVSLVKTQYDEQRSEQRMKNDRLEWRQAAMVFDRLFFYVFLFMFMITVAWIFSESPGYIE